MPKHDEGRRAFLVGTAVAGAAATTALVPAALAQTNNQTTNNQDMPMPGESVVPAMDGGHGAFFNDADSRTIKAFTERLMPGAPGKPGATDADVLNYIDLALSGPYKDHQDFYRRGVTQLNAHCLSAYGKEFANLPPDQQDAAIMALEHGKAPEFVWPAAQVFFNTVRTHTMEGMFADPIYGGNKDFAGWRLVGFPGAQMQFTAEDMQSKDAFTREPIVGLQSQLTRKKG
jgi:gluconate 2-dehydrogenase gamma chain